MKRTESKSDYLQVIVLRRALVERMCELSREHLNEASREYKAAMAALRSSK